MVMKVKPVSMKVHPSLFEQTERFRKLLESNGIRPSTTKATELMARNIKLPNKLNAEENGFFAKRKKRKYI